MTADAPLRASHPPAYAETRDASNPKVRRILVAARQLFMERGYGETSMDAIAQKAAVSKATLYSHFEGKDALFAALIVSECRHLSRRIGASAMNGPDIRSSLLEIAEDFNNLLCTGDGLTMYRIVVAEAPRFPELGRIFYDSGPKEMIDRIADVLRSASDRGLLKIPDPRVAAMQFISLIKGESQLTRILGLRSSRKSSSEYVKQSIDLFLAGYGPEKRRR